MSQFFCDADCELTYKEFDELNIHLIEMPYTIDGKEIPYDLGRNVDCRDFFARMRKGACPKTQALNKFDYINYFEPVFAGGEDIIYVSFSKEMSGTFNQMNAAVDELKEKYPERKFTWVDTGSISMGAGIMVKYAAMLHNEGADDEKVAQFVEEFRRKVRVYVTVEDLVYLKRGGRISSLKANIGTLFNMKPIIANNFENNGKLESIETVKGRKTALKRLAGFIASEGYDARYPLYLLNGDVDEDAEILTEFIKEVAPDLEVRPQLIGPVIGCHCGPGTLGIIYVTK